MFRVVLNMFVPFQGPPAQNIGCEAADERVKKGSMKSSSHAESSMVPRGRKGKGGGRGSGDKRGKG